jgi:hypothetical protein
MVRAGGPVFLKRGVKNPCMIGIVIEARMDAGKARYLNLTIATVASLIKDILEGEDMKKQINDFLARIFPKERCVFYGYGQ